METFPREKFLTDVMFFFLFCLIEFNNPSCVEKDFQSIRISLLAVIIQNINYSCVTLCACKADPEKPKDFFSTACILCFGCSFNV